jgi:hypothetical protein
VTVKRLYPGWVEQQLCEVTGFDQSLVREMNRLAKHVVDQLTADDFSVMAPPLLVLRDGDPVVERAIQLLRDPSWQAPEDLWTLSEEEIAEALTLDVSTVERFRVANEIHILMGMLDHAGISTDDPEVEEIGEFVYAWLDTWDAHPGRGRPRRRYSTSTVGSLERLRNWFTANSAWVGGENLPLGRLVRATDDSRLLYSLKDADPTDPEHVLVTLHPGMVDEQMLESVLQKARAEGDVEWTTAPPERWLVADGLTIPAQNLMAESEIGYLSLTEIGYRQHLFDEELLDVSEQPDPDPVRLRATCVIV